MTMTGATIGENIRRVRWAAGHRHQGAFAAQAGLSQSWLSDVERGHLRNPSLDNLLKVAAAVPCRLDELVQGVNAAFDESRARLPGGEEVQAEALVRRFLQLHPVLVAYFKSEVALYERIDPKHLDRLRGTITYGQPDAT